MATKTYLFTGKTKWAKPTKLDEKFDNYQMPLYMDEKSWADFKESGARTEIKKDKDTGEEFTTFKRRHKEMNWKKGEMQENGPAKVFIKNDEGEYVPFDGLIGNGSEVSVRVDVFDTRNGKGHRLVSVGVDKLVEYNPDKVDSNVPDMPF